MTIQKQIIVCEDDIGMLLKYKILHTWNKATIYLHFYVYYILK